MSIPYLDLTIQQKAIEPQLQDLMQKVVRGGQYILGPEVLECEKKLAEFVGAPYCLTTASGTGSLLMGLLARDITVGDEIIVPSFSFFATAEIVALIGAVPVFVDIEPDTFNIDVSKIKDAITSKTKGIITVSLYGQVADMKEVNAIAKKHGLFVMEDAAQSFGAKYGDKVSCNTSDMGSTSFFPAKPLGCYGDGGAIFCQTKEDYEALAEVRVHGQSGRYHHTRIGYNGRLDTLQCAVLLVKLERYPWEVEQRQRIATAYNEAFSGIEQITTPVLRADRDSVYAQYTLKTKDRDGLQNSLQELGVPTSIHYPKGMHQQPALEKYFPKTPLPVTETVCEEVLSLPLYADMPQEHVEFVIEKVKKVFS